MTLRQLVAVGLVIRPVEISALVRWRSFPLYCVNSAGFLSYVVLFCTVHVHAFSKRITGTCPRYFLLRAVNYYYFLTPVLNSRGMKKLHYAIQKSTKIKLEWTLLFLLLLLLLLLLPSVLWRCWLGGRKGIRPVKNWVLGYWHGYLSGARCRLAYGPADATATHCLLLQ